MEQLSLSDIVTGAWEEIKGHVLKVLKEAVELMLVDQQSNLLGRRRYQRGGSRGWRWGYRQRKSFLTPWGSLEGLKIPRIREEGHEVSWLRKNERRLKEIGECMFSAVVGGMNLRRESTSLYHLLKDSLSFSSISAMIKKAHNEIAQMRGRPLRKAQYKALVPDGIMVTLRRGYRRRKGVLLVAVGVDEEGECEVVDWEVRRREDFEGYYVLLNRLYERGIEEVELVVGDWFSCIFSAVDMIYPFSRRQLCLIHLAKNLERHLADRSLVNRRRLRREFWWIYEAVSREEVLRFYEAFRQRWKQREPEMVSLLERYFPVTTAYYACPRQ